MKIECTPQELECLQKTRELVASEANGSALRSELAQKNSQNWELRDVNANLQYRLTEAEDRCRRLAENAAQYQSQSHVDSDTRVRFLSIGNRNKLNDLIGFVAVNNRIQMIKAYRELTGLGLKDAKDFIDQVVPRLD